MTAVKQAIAVGAIVASVASAGVAGQTTGPRVPPLVSESFYGQDLFTMYCASCHGRDARGAGPAAAALKTAPPDLTTLARRHEGKFPSADVELMIRGPAMASHGSDEMPVWGPIFRALDPSDARANARIRSLVSYLESIQQH